MNTGEIIGANQKKSQILGQLLTHPGLVTNSGDEEDSGSVTNSGDEEEPGSCLEM